MNLKDILLLPIESPMVMAITITLFVTGSITTFDTRLTQAKRSGALPADHPDPPFWINLFYWIHYGLIVGLLFIDWKYAIVLVVILFFLQVLPVLETSGNVLMAPLGPAMRRAAAKNTSAQADVDLLDRKFEDWLQKHPIPEGVGVRQRIEWRTQELRRMLEADPDCRAAYLAGIERGERDYLGFLEDDDLDAKTDVPQ